jgi:hypothetical protein
MSFYVLEIMGSRWGTDNNLLSFNPYRITWENKESGQKICEIFIKMISESEKGSLEPYETIHMGFRFYKYEKSFDFKLKPSQRPRPVSNVYIPSNYLTYINICKVISYSLTLLESNKNGAEITAVTETELKEALEEVESEV